MSKVDEQGINGSRGREGDDATTRPVDRAGRGIVYIDRRDLVSYS